MCIRPFGVAADMLRPRYWRDRRSRERSASAAFSSRFFSLGPRLEKSLGERGDILRLAPRNRVAIAVTLFAPPRPARITDVVLQAWPARQRAARHDARRYRQPA